MQPRNQKPSKSAFHISLTLIGLLVLVFAVSYQPALAQSPLHPTFPLLDKEGNNVLDSGNPVSTTETCGQCHDSAFIEEHSFHAQVGQNEIPESGRAWDTGTGLFGRWNPITYRYLSPEDLSTEEWVKTIGLRHVGGGPATEEGVEMNCFLCHLTEPDNQARTDSLVAGDFDWANTATLAASGIVSYSGNNWSYNTDAFSENGELTSDFVFIQDPDNQNCAQCHGIVHTQEDEPIVAAGCESGEWETETTGQIISDQRLYDSGINLENKTSLSHSWDIHAERDLQCTDCHFSLNNPVYAQGEGVDTLDHLEFDPRRLDIGEYLYQPLHQFARGQSAQNVVAPELKGTMRRCESCHNPDVTHDWLPYQDKHMEALNCETCHIPEINMTALQQVDWTVVETDGSSRNSCRGTEGNTGTVSDLVTGYTPVLMQRSNIDGEVKLTPYNLISSWFWVYGEPASPVPQDVLQAAWLEDGVYADDILAAFDANQDGKLSKSELVIDDADKENLIASRLEDLGMENPRILAEVQPYSVNHNVVNGDWAIKDCETCHDNQSRITGSIQLASYIPGGVMPEFVTDSNTLNEGELYTENGALYYRPFPQDQGTYILGHDSVSWIDWAGVLMFLGALLGVVGHGGLRVYAAMRNPVEEKATKRIYMYSFYERLWHWLQTVVILVLIFTGLVIHKPAMFGMFSFRNAVLVHNVMAFILVANAALALFYNLVSGDIKRFLPAPRGFFNQAVEQVIFYTKGIFSGDEHPFEKTREKRLNPLQKITYLGILNVLLPLQVITGILMWGAQRWPEAANALGGLPFLAPFHTLVAWTFAAFIVAHVYLTTTGHKPMGGIQSMINGWDEVEVHSQHDSEE